MQLGFHRLSSRATRDSGSSTGCARSEDRAALANACVSLLLCVCEQLAADAGAERLEVLVAEILGEVVVNGRQLALVDLFGGRAPFDRLAGRSFWL